MYYRVKENIYADYGTTRDPELPRRVAFSTGTWLDSSVDVPLEFLVDNTDEAPPGAFEGITVPAFSDALVEVLQSCGVDNMQVFQAQLRNPDTGQLWRDYFAVNIVGKVSCADLGASHATEIAKRSDNGLPLYKFHRLVIDPQRARDLLVFRLAEQPSTIIMHHSVVDRIAGTPNRRGDGWGLSCFPIDET